MEVKENIMATVTFKLAVVVWKTDHKKDLCREVWACLMGCRGQLVV